MNNVPVFKALTNFLTQHKLPGEDAQFRLAPIGRRQLQFKRIKYKRSSVLLLLEDVPQKLPNLIFIKRAAYDGVHSGQIAFPGGRFEPDKDQTLLHTALRETKEELAIAINPSQIIGQLTALKIPISGFEVQPFVAALPPNATFQPDKKEVEDIFRFSVNKLLSSAPRNGRFLTSYGDVEAPYYPLKRHKLWGATAMITAELLEVFKNVFLSDKTLEFKL